MVLSELDEGAAVAGGEMLQEFLDVTGTGVDVLAVAVIAVDDGEETGCLQGKLGALVVAGGCAYSAEGVTIDGQTGDVEGAAANAFVGFTFLTDAEGEGGHWCPCGRTAGHTDLVGIKASDAVTVGNAGEVDEIHQGVHLI